MARAGKKGEISVKGLQRLAILLGFLIFLVVVVVFLLAWRLNDLVKMGMEEGIPPVTGTRVTVGEVSISPLSGRGELGHFILYNPEGFSTAPAISIDHIAVQLQLNSLFENVIVIPEVSIEGAQVLYEFGPGGSNIKKIKAHVRKVLGTTREKKEKGEETKVIIDHFVMKEGKVGVMTSLFKKEPVILVLPPIELRDIGRKEGGVTREEAIQQILDQLGVTLEKTVAANQGLLEELKDKIGGLLSEGSEKVGELIEGGKEKVEEVLQNEKVKGAAEKLKGLFKRGE